MAKPAKRKIKRAKAKAPLRPRPRKKRAPAPAAEPAGAIPSWISPMLDAARVRPRRRAAELSASHPEEGTRALGARLVRSRANRAGLAGGRAGTPAAGTLPT